MKISEQLRAGARYMERHGFDAGLQTAGCARCFLGSMWANHRFHREADDAAAFLAKTIWDEEYTGPDDGLDRCFGLDALKAEGWTTSDAVAAMNIAADCAECDGL